MNSTPGVCSAAFWSDWLGPAKAFGWLCRKESKRDPRFPRFTESAHQPVLRDVFDGELVPHIEQMGLPQDVAGSRETDLGGPNVSSTMSGFLVVVGSNPIRTSSGKYSMLHPTTLSSESIGMQMWQPYLSLCSNESML